MLVFNAPFGLNKGFLLAPELYVKCTILILILSLGACGKEPATVKEVIRPAKIITVTAGGGSAIRSFPGVTEATDSSELAFRVSGELIKLPIKPGNIVKKDQLLAQLDPRDFKLKVSDKKAKFDLAKVQYKRMAELVKEGLVPRAEYDKAKSQLQATTADLELAKANLDDTNLRAPFDGVISSVPVKNYENVQVKQTIMTIQSQGTVDIAFQLPESIMAQVKRGQAKQYPPTIVFDAYPLKEFTAAVKELDTQADPQTQTYRVVLTMDTPDSFTVLPGMTVSVLVKLRKIIGSSTAMIVPVESVFAASDQPVDSRERYVWRVTPDSMTVSRTPVTVGRLSSLGIELKSGVKAGDKIIAAGVHFLKEGQKVREWTRERGL